MVLNCIKPIEASRIEWSRENSAPLPPQSYDDGDRLVIPRIRREDAGVYYCTAYYSNGATQPTSAVVNVVGETRFRFLHTRDFLLNEHCFSSIT